MTCEPCGPCVCEHHCLHAKHHLRRASTVLAEEKCFLENDVAQTFFSEPMTGGTSQALGSHSHIAMPCDSDWAPTGPAFDFRK